MPNNHLPAVAYRADIDGLRAFAVLAVLGFHAFPNTLEGGFIGVDIFFVISGFLISSLILKGLVDKKFNFSAFYLRRIKRIFPALILILCFCLVFGWFTLWVNEYKQLGKHIASSAIFISNYIYWGEAGYFDGGPESKPLLHLWSLAIEEQFYILWPLVLWFCWKKGLNLLTVIVLLSTLSFIVNIIWSYSDRTAAFYAPQTRAWEFLLGGALAWLEVLVGKVWLQRLIFSDPKNFPEKLIHNFLSLCGSTLIIYALATVTSTNVFPGYWAVFPALGSALIIAGGPTAWINRKILSHPIAVWFGLISFPLYLWHWPLLFFARDATDDSLSAYVVIAVLIVSVVFAWLTFKLIEQPIRNTRLNGKICMALLSLMLGLGVSGYFIVWDKGIPSRFPPEASALTTSIDFHWGDHVRIDQCHLQGKRSLDFPSLCAESQKPSLALWGDSYAASLYPGIEQLKQRYKFSVIQQTASGCPPIFNLERLYERPNCNELNERTLANLVKLNPTVVILQAAWIHEQYPLSLEEFSTKLNESLKRIQSALPNSKLVLIGPVPRWKMSPQRASFRAWVAQGKPSGGVASRLDAADWPLLNARLEDSAKRLGIKYIDPYKVFCDDGGCLARVGSEPEDFVSMDSAHLSKAGSIYFANKIWSQLESSLKANATDRQ
jgi:peptidoglycan/LPS O-acetylase OafA/YrhL